MKKQKKYGLIWEDVSEKVAAQCSEKLPILSECPKKHISSTKDGDVNIFVEGDNYHALSVLNYTHNKKVDVIYIDPPYNGDRDLKYNDTYVEKDNEFRHSMWISFMSKRLKLAKNLLKDDGVIFMSIDDEEYAVLKLLCDEIFGENNFLSNMVWHTRNPNIGIFSNDTEYVLVYAKDKKKINPAYQEKHKKNGNWFGRDYYRPYSNVDGDERGDWRAGGHTKTKNKNPFSYSINVNNGKIDDNKIVEPGWYYSNLWSYSKSTIKELYDQKRIYSKTDDKGKVSAFKIKKFKSEEINKATPISLIEKSFVSTNAGKVDFHKLGFNDKDFQYPKPVALLKYLLGMKGQNITILDFFAGSGTTAQAVLEMNRDDGGQRKFILCTNNEENIAHDVTHKRIEKVIKGYTSQIKAREQLFKQELKTYSQMRIFWGGGGEDKIDQIVKNNVGKYTKIDVECSNEVLYVYGEVAKDQFIAGIPSNLRYYKTGFVGASTTDTNKIKITREATHMLCVKENTFNKVEKNDDFHIYNNGIKHTAIIYDTASINGFIKSIKNIKGDFNVYLFLLGEDYKTKLSKSKKVKNVLKMPDNITKIYNKIFEVDKE